jgi:hypothetical protein
MRTILAFVTPVLVIAVGSPVSADPWKDESGKRKGRDAYGWQDDGPGRDRDRYRRAERIPRGHMPPPGECRTWYRGVPPGHQPPPYRC